VNYKQFIPDREGAAIKKDRTNWFQLQYNGPHGRPFGRELPANDQSDPMCQIYSFSNYEQAQENNMILSSTGTRIFLNVDGLRKVYTNIIGLYPEYNQDLLSFFSNNKMFIKNMGSIATQVITRDMNNFLHFFAGVGSMNETDIATISNKGPMSSNGTLDTADFRLGKKTGTKPVYNCGQKVFTEMLKAFGDFYMWRVSQDLNDAENAGDQDAIDRLTSKKMNIANLLKVKNGSEKPKVAQANQGQAISSKIKNEFSLLAEIAEFMAEHDIQTAQFEQAMQVANFLNSGGSDAVDETGALKWVRRPSSRVERVKKKTFNAGNVSPLMQKVLNRGLLADSNLSIQEIAVELASKATDIKKIYNDEHRNTTKKIQEEDAEAEEPEEGEDERRVNLIWDEKNQKFISMDIHRNFYEVFEYIQGVTESMAYQFDEQHLRKIDAGTGALLTPTDAMGNPLATRIPMVFKNPPRRNITSEELETIFRNMSPEQQAKSRLLWGDEEMHRVFEEVFGPELIGAIDLRDYDYQVANEEVDEEMLAQRAEDEEVEELPDVNIPPEAEDVVQPEEDDEGIEEEYQAQYAHDPFADMDDDEDEFDFGDDDDDVGPVASTDAINNLVKLSEELDNEGKVAESIELLRLAKKFSRKLRRG
jgi:hypothetical protein